MVFELHSHSHVRLYTRDQNSARFNLWLHRFMDEIKMIVNFYSTYRSFLLTPKAAHRRCYVCNKCFEQYSGRKYHRAWKGELIRILLFRAGERWRRLEYNHIIVLDGKIREYYASITLLTGLISLSPPPPRILLYLFKFTSHHFLFSLSVCLEGAEFIYSQLCALPCLSILPLSSLFTLKVCSNNEIYALRERIFIMQKSD